MNYYKRFPGDYSRDTAHLSLAEHGAYALLLDVYYATSRPLPNDRPAVHRICRAFTAAERKAVDSILDQFFFADGDLLRNARADREIEAEQVRISKARENGNRGGRPRKNQNGTEEKPAGFSEETQEGSEKKALQRQHQVTTSPDQGFTTFTPAHPGGEGFELTPEAKDLHPAKPTQLNPGTTRAREANAVPVSAETWTAYAAAYRQRYGVDPVRNATVSAQLAAFVKRLGAEEAPQVAAFYVRHNGAFYVRNKHATGPMLKDAEGLRTEWATGRMVTNTEAQQQDRKQNTVNAFAPLLAEARAREANGK